MLEDVRVKWCQFWVFLGPGISRFGYWIATLFCTWGICINGSSLLCVWFCSHRQEMTTQCKRTPAVGVPLTKAIYVIIQTKFRIGGIIDNLFHYSAHWNTRKTCWDISVNGILRCRLSYAHAVQRYLHVDSTTCFWEIRAIGTQSRLCPCVPAIFW